MQGKDLGQYVAVSGTAAGTTNVLTRKGNFHGVFCDGTAAGTIAFYDQNAGTSASTLIHTLDQNLVGTTPARVDYGFRVKKGLTAVATGVYDVVVIYE